MKYPLLVYIFGRLVSNSLNSHLLHARACFIAYFFVFCEGKIIIYQITIYNILRQNKYTMLWSALFAVIRPFLDQTIKNENESTDSSNYNIISACVTFWDALLCLLLSIWREAHHYASILDRLPNWELFPALAFVTFTHLHQNVRSGAV